MMKKYTVITKEILDDLTKQSKKTERKRKNYNLHNLEDTVQRFFNALEPETYVRPHRHHDPPKIETFIRMRGNFSVIFFDDSGTITDIYELSERSGNMAVDILPGIWHSVVSHEPGTVYFEVKEGPYVSTTDKDFAPWAPGEGSKESERYLDFLKKECKRDK